MKRRVTLAPVGVIPAGLEPATTKVSTLPLYLLRYGIIADETLAWLDVRQCKAQGEIMTESKKRIKPKTVEESLYDETFHLPERLKNATPDQLARIALTTPPKSKRKAA